MNRPYLQLSQLMKAFTLAFLSLAVFSASLFSASLFNASLLNASWQGQTLRQAAERSGLLVSTAVRATQLAEPAYASTLAREFNMLEPEDAMKWWVLRPDARSYDFRQGDELVQFAREHGMKVRGHCLVWGRSNPQWLTQGHFTDATTVAASSRTYQSRDAALCRAGVCMGRGQRGYG